MNVAKKLECLSPVGLYCLV